MGVAKMCFKQFKQISSITIGVLLFVVITNCNNIKLFKLTFLQHYLRQKQMKILNN